MEPDFRDDTAHWERIGEEQNRLEPDVRCVSEYGLAHPEEWVGVRLDNAGEVRVFTAFTDHLEVHQQALRALVGHPERLTVERHPHSAVRLEEIREELQAQLFHGDERIGLELTSLWARIWVVLQAWAEPVARQLHERYGDALEIIVGALPYPPRPFSRCPPKPEATVGVDGLELRLELDQHSVRSGDEATGRLILRNVGHGALGLGTGEPMVGVTMNREGQVVGVLCGAINVPGVGFRLAPAEEGSVRAIVGTASCSSRVGYLLPPGQYSAVVPLHVYGDMAPKGEMFGVLVPPPAKLILT